MPRDLLIFVAMYAIYNFSKTDSTQATVPKYFKWSVLKGNIPIKAEIINL